MGEGEGRVQVYTVAVLWSDKPKPATLAHGMCYLPRPPHLLLLFWNPLIEILLSIPDPDYGGLQKSSHLDRSENRNPVLDIPGQESPPHLIQPRVSTSLRQWWTSELQPPLPTSCQRHLPALCTPITPQSEQSPCPPWVRGCMLSLIFTMKNTCSTLHFPPPPGTSRTSGNPKLLAASQLLKSHQIGRRCD